MTKLINYISQYTNEFVNAFRLCVDLDVYVSIKRTTLLVELDIFIQYFFVD